MKITFLGTGAADWPLERPDGAAEFRRLSSALIDDTLLIDPGPQVCDALREYGKDPAEIRYVIYTHRHSDHYSQETVDRLAACGAELVTFSAGDHSRLGAHEVFAYAGNHATCSGVVHYVISDGTGKLFYGLDGAWLCYEEYRAIMEQRPDFAVFDATIGWMDGDYRIFEHNNLNMVLEMKKTLLPYIGKFCISHMAMTLHEDQKTLESRMLEHGVLTAYDGAEFLF